MQTHHLHAINENEIQSLRRIPRPDDAVAGKAPSFPAEVQRSGILQPNRGGDFSWIGGSLDMLASVVGRPIPAS